MINGAAQLQETGAHGTRTIVHWRNGCVREGDTRLEDLRDPESACCARDAVLGAGLCLKTRTGARLHKRKCGDMEVDLVQVYAYLDHDDLQTMCIKLRCSICTLCQFKFTVERFLGANGPGPAPASTPAPLALPGSCTPALRPLQVPRQAAAQYQPFSSNGVAVGSTNSRGNGTANSTPAAGGVSHPARMALKDPEVAHLQKQVGRLESKVGRLTQLREKAAAEAATAAAKEHAAQKQEIGQLHRRAAEAAAQHAAAQAHARQQQQQLIKQLQGQVVEAAAQQAAAQTQAQQQRQLIGQLQGQVAGAAAQQAAAQAQAQQQQELVGQLQGQVAEAATQQAAAQAQAGKQQQLIEQLQGQVAGAVKQQGAAQAQAAQQLQLKMEWLEGEVAALKAEVERLTRRPLWTALLGPCGTPQ